MPDWYEEEPHLMPGERFYITAYFDLCTCKNQNGDIPWNVINEYGRCKGLEDVTLTLFINVIIYMNALRMKESENKTLKRQKGDERKTKNERRRKGFSHTGSSGGRR